MLDQSRRQDIAAQQPRVKPRTGIRCHQGKDYFHFVPHPNLTEQCNICGGCENSEVTYKDGTVIEYLGIVQIDDSSYPSLYSEKTQENVLEYLRRSPPDLILVNHGHHLGINSSQPLAKVMAAYR